MIRRSRLRLAAGLAGFAALVGVDVFVANWRVARRVLGGGPVRAGFVTVPIELADERAVVVLAHAVTLTPGTVTIEIGEDRRALLVHALDAADPAALVRQIKDRYERRLRRIFGC